MITTVLLAIAATCGGFVLGVLAALFCFKTGMAEMEDLVTRDCASIAAVEDRPWPPGAKDRSEDDLDGPIPKWCWQAPDIPMDASDQNNGDGEEDKPGKNMSA